MGDELGEELQVGAAGVIDGFPVLWVSKISSVAFAHALIGEGHADISSAADEI